MSEATPAKPRFDLSLASAHLILRLWVAMRLIMAGVDKFRAGNGPDTTFSFENYDKKSTAIANLMATNSLLPAALCGPYAHSIGYVLLLVGLWTLIGLFTELSLLAAGLVFLSLGFGLAALPDDLELSANIGVAIIITALALYTARGNKFSLDGVLFRKK
ncbi:DoxX family membrane protein [Phragmitibacter flavus]|uniref:DoxX family membrane protein n=1 Tax=Phragmitibacter flavus TaxID=2576071 RepID=A0A5R8KBI4_9BACT|nr:DoxX family membrane protein [Phragmitibacter flavus]TLD69661.1 DoxX family membrane protein [Phragmitibacter flavus]